jgi:hypothetical protein
LCRERCRCDWWRNFYSARWTYRHQRRPGRRHSGLQFRFQQFDASLHRGQLLRDIRRACRIWSSRGPSGRYVRRYIWHSRGFVHSRHFHRCVCLRRSLRVTPRTSTYHETQNKHRRKSCERHGSAHECICDFQVRILHRRSSATLSQWVVCSD